MQLLLSGSMHDTTVQHAQPRRRHLVLSMLHGLVVHVAFKLTP